MRIDLREYGEPVEVRLDTAVALTLGDTGVVDVRHIPGTSRWQVRPLGKVGAIRVGTVEVHVAPKVPIDRVVFMVGYATKGVAWRDDHVDVEQAPDLIEALAEAFIRFAESATRQGLLQGYRMVEEPLQVVRGRIREDEQIRRRFGLMVPVEVRYDDYTVDIAENRLLRAGVSRLLRMPSLALRLRRRLAHLDRLLADVTAPTRGVHLEPWQPSRLNARYVNALRLAEVILAGSSFEPGGTGLTVTGFVLDMPAVFEAFVCTALADALAPAGGRSVQQDRWHLDEASRVAMRPDLVWYAPSGAPAAVVDAKYKAEKYDGFPNADLYQLLAYCTALGLTEGHLVYAKGNEPAVAHQLRGSGVRVTCYALDLSQSPELMLGQIDALAGVIRPGAVRPSDARVR